MMADAWQYETKSNDRISSEMLILSAGDNLRGVSGKPVLKDREVRCTLHSIVCWQLTCPLASRPVLHL